MMTLCGHEEARKGIGYKATLYPHSPLFFDTSIAVCPECGMGTVRREPSADKLAKFYREDYRSPWSAHHVAAGPAPISMRGQAQVALLRQYGGIRPGSSLLDIGPGPTADTIRAAKIAEPGVGRLAVYEPDPPSQRRLRRYGAEVIGGDFPAESNDDQFDSVIMSHVLEHYRPSDLPAVLASVRESLAPGGLFLCEVPHADLRIHAHRSNDAPHLLFFSERAFRELLIAHSFDVLFFSTVGPVWREAAAAPVPSIPVRLLRKAGRGIRSLLAPIPRAAKALVTPPSNAAWLTSEEFAYGGDRQCLRAVARVRE